MADCAPNEETLQLVGLRGVGCSKEAAKLDLFARLLADAAGRRATKCEDLECEGLESGDCVTSIADAEWQRIEGQIQYRAIRRRKCPGGIGWVAVLTLNPPNYKTICTCVPPEREDEGDKKDKKKKGKKGKKKK